MRSKITLQDAFKTSTYDQDKVISPEETVKRFKDRLRQVKLDILHHTERIDKGRLDIPVYFSVCGKDAQAVIGNKKQMGKGASAAQAEASAVMELAERFSFFSFCRNPDNFVIDTFDNLGDKALDFDAIALSVHDRSADLGATRALFAAIPMRWTWAWNFTAERPVLVPFDWFYAINEFNGPSAGNCQEEALSQGICEIVERHVSSLISRGRRQVPAIRPESAQDPMVRDMLAKYQRNGIRLFVQDFTLEMGIPSVGVMAYDPASFPGRSEIVWTAGTTPSPEKAYSRALTEVAQLAGDFDTNANYVASGLPKFAQLEQADFIMQAERMVDLGSLPDLSHANIRVEVERLIDALAHRNLEVLVVDTQHPDLGIPAFYTIVPGTHFRERAEGTSVGMFAAKLVVDKYSPDAALEELGRFDRILPERHYVQFYMGLCHLNAGRAGAALPHLERARALEPTAEDLASILAYTGMAYKEMERYPEALAVLAQGVALDAERTDLHNLMGFCHFKLKAHAAAIECFKTAIKLNPGSGIDYANIASNYRELGKIDEAIRYYKMALEIDPGIDFAWENLARLSAGRPDA